MRKKRKIFLDCGANLGQELCEFVKIGKIENDTEVHSFEPNPFCDVSEFSLKRLAKDLDCNPQIRFHRSNTRRRRCLHDCFIKRPKKVLKVMQFME